MGGFFYRGDTMRRAMGLACLVLMIGAGPATKPAEQHVTPEQMLNSVPKQFTGQNAEEWLRRTYEGRTVIFSGIADKPRVSLEKGKNVVTFGVTSPRPGKWLKEPLTVGYTVVMEVSEAEAARFAEQPHGKKADLQIRFAGMGLEHREAPAGAGRPMQYTWDASICGELIEHKLR